MKATIRTALLVSLAFFAVAASAAPELKQPPGPQVMPSLDKVTMESFVTEPATIPPGTTQILLRVTVKNVTNTGGATGFVLNGLKLKIFRTNPQPDVLELESTVNNLAPGTSQTFGARVNIAPGVREYFARVDTDDTLHEPLVQRANNERRLKMSIPQVSGQQAAAPGSAPALDTQFLDYDLAKNAGAQFANGIDGAAGLCANRTGQFGGASVNDQWKGVAFRADCDQSPNGVRATPEAFTGFRLKNGWKVKEFAIFGVEKSRHGADWQWRQTPAKGTDDPSMRMHVFAEPNTHVKVRVKVEIEGPTGTNPYQ
jgi:hypothetical protein